MQSAVARITQWMAARQPARVVTLGAEMVMLAKREPGYREVINAADLVVADTVGILLAARALKTPLPQRVPGIEMLEELCAVCAARGWPVYLLGARGDTAAKAAAALASRHRGLRIAGTHHGYFTLDSQSAVIERIKQSGARLVLVALGFPRQEFWTRAHCAQLGGAVCIGVGGSFDVLAGRIKRAPHLLRRAGLEWFYRLVREPRRLRRQLVLPQFAMQVAAQALRRPRSS